MEDLVRSAYAIMIFALEPRWQDWVVAGIDEAKRLHPDRSYSESFPLLIRCLALIVCVFALNFSNPSFPLFPPLIRLPFA